MWKKCKVMRLQTFNNDGVIYVNPMESKPYVKGKWKLDQDKFQYHLHVISDEDIKEGDWCYIKYDFSQNSGSFIFQATNIADDEYFKNKPSKAKKIIASTDPSLNVARPSNEFLQAYCKAGGIGEVLIEYTYNVCNNYDHPTKSMGERYNFRPKVAPDNTVTIKKVKNSWSREEIENFILQKLDIFYMNIESKNHRLPLEEEIKDFLRENL